MRVVVTGGTGFIGGHLLEALVARGDQVISFERPGASRAWIAHLPLEVRPTSWSDPAGLAAACDGADVVFHLAGRTSARTAGEYQRVNVDGTAAVMRAAASSGSRPPHVVLLSSFSAVGPCRHGELLSARSAPDPLSPYGESKLRAEAVVHAWADRVPATVLRPTSVYGPRERGVLKFFRMVRRGFAIAVGDWERRVQLLHVLDLVRLLLRVADSPRAAGRTWCVAHPDTLTWRTFAGTVGRAVGRAPLLLRVPVPLTGVIARGAELAARLRGGASSLNRYRVRELANDWVCDAEQAWADLGLQPEVSLDAGVAATVAWYRAAGWL
jgi:nucleoside-diphosphate-sugar epimerase